MARSAEPPRRLNRRFFSHQPNVPGRGIVATYGAVFWALVIVIGLVAGLGGAALMELLRAVEHLVWSYDSGTFLQAVEHVSPAHVVLVLLAAGVLAGAGAMVLKRLHGFGGGEVSEAVWPEDGRSHGPARPPAATR